MAENTEGDQPRTTVPKKYEQINNGLIAIECTLLTDINSYCLTSVKRMSYSCQTNFRHVSDDCPTAVRRQRFPAFFMPKL